MKKIINILLGCLICGGIASAETVFPNMTESDSYGAKSVDISGFIPLNVDYTVEINGTPNEKIVIKAAHVEYTPQAEGHVRFVQKNGTIYVFEGKEFKTTLTPTYHYSVSDINLIPNGSFEDATLLDGRTDRWKATGWTPTDWNGEVKWGTGGDQVTVRENASYRSDGQKSIVLHFSNRYLTQKLQTTFEGTPYQFSCDYWTSNGNNNGGKNYELLLGSTNRGEDILKIPAYKTVNGDYTKKSCTLTFMIPEVSGDVYLSLRRNDSGCDWLDNVRLSRIESVDKGLSGAQRATFAMGAYAPVGAVYPSDALMERDGFIINPSFENDLTGWNNSNMWLQSNNGMAENGATKEGNKYVERWVDQNSNVGVSSISQEIELPNGLWLIKANAFALHQSGTPAEISGVSVFAGYGAEAKVVKGADDYQIVATVAEGKLNIGFKSTQTEANWIGVDNFRIYQYLDDSKADYPGYLRHVLDEFYSIVDDMENRPTVYNKETIEKAIAQAGAAQSNDEIIASIASLRAAQTEYMAIVAEYTALKTEIAYAETLCADNDYTGKDEFVAAITKAKDTLASTTATIDEVKAETAFLKKASERYKTVKDSFDLLGSEITIARTFADNSDYSSKEEFKKAIDEAQKVFDAGTVDAEGISAAVNALREASKAYLANRPEEWFTITNGAIWKDNDGLDVQAHGAGIILVNDTWYMIGEDRTQQWNPDVNMYSSKDLVNWKFERKIIENGVTHPDLGKSRMIERPKLLYNKKTGKFVVWCHWEAGNYGASEAGVFVSDVVNGEYKFVSGSRPLDVKSRDCNVFVDDDGTAYFISTIDENRHLGLFKLSDDYLTAVEWTQLFDWQSREAPAIVKHDGVYYMLSSACSGWDPNQCKLAWSTNLVKGWSGLRDIGNKIAYDTQAASILTVQGTKGTTYLYVGDRWQDPNLPDSKTIIFPISFDNSDHSCQFPYHQSFDINFVTGEWREHNNPYALDKTGWSVKAYSSQENADNAASYAIDGRTDNNRWWHTAWSNYAAAPHYITIDMGKEQDINGFMCVPRTDKDTNGLIRAYTFQTSTDGETWTTVSSGSWMPYWSEVEFKTTMARYFKITALSGTYASISEIEIYYNPDKGDYDQPEGLTSYYQINDGEWQSGDKIIVDEGSKLNLGPNTSGRIYGTWNLELPDGSFTGTREHSVESFSQQFAGTYNAHFLDMNNKSHVMPIEVSLNATTGGSAIGADSAIAKEEYHTLTGIKVDKRNLAAGIYIRLVIMNDATTQCSKVIIK